MGPKGINEGMRPRYDEPYNYELLATLTCPYVKNSCHEHFCLVMTCPTI